MNIITNEPLHNNIISILDLLKQGKPFNPVKNIVIGLNPGKPNPTPSPGPNPVVPSPSPGPTPVVPSPSPGPTPVVPSPSPGPEPGPGPGTISNHYEEFKCKAMQIMQNALNEHLQELYISENLSLTATKNSILEKSNYVEFKLKAIQIMEKVAADKAKTDALAAAAEAKTKAEKAAEAEKTAKTALAAAQTEKQSAQEEINKLNYAEFKTKALEKMRDIQLAQDAMNNNYQTFVLKATAVLNNVATQGLNDKINDNATKIIDAKQTKLQLEQEFAYKEFKQKAELVLIRSLTGDISKQLADHQKTIETDNYTEFKLKAQMVLTQALLNSQQQKYMEQQQQGLYEQFKSNALNVLTSIVAQQSFYNEFKEKALIVLNDISRDYKIQSLTNDKYYEEFKQKALASLTYMNPELGSTEWVSAL